MTVAALNAGVGLALSTVREHKLRSFLTVLGVIIGTGAVIGVGSIIAGLDGAITGLMRSMGPDTVIVTKTAAMGRATREERARRPLTSPIAVLPWSMSARTCSRHRECTRRGIRAMTFMGSIWAGRRKPTPRVARR